MYTDRLMAKNFLQTEEERLALESFGFVRIPLDLPFQAEPVNAILVMGDPPALIDTGMRHLDNIPTLEATFAQYGLDLKDLGEIWLTHPHLDHFGLAGWLANNSAARVHAWRQSVERYENYLQLWQDERSIFIDWLMRSGVDHEQVDQVRTTPSHFHKTSSAVRISHRIDADIQICIAGRHKATMLHVPGHSPWCTALWFEEAKILVAGDVLLARNPSNPLLYPVDAAPNDWQGFPTFRRSLRRLSELAVNRVIPGHGFSFTNHRDTTERVLQRQKRRQVYVRKILKNGAKNTYQLAISLFGEELTRRSLYLVMSETARHLDWLESLGEVAYSEEPSQRLYYLVEENQANAKCL
jgi:glyoxylase-like metal-dependent hydrolase (beta-lactamase superfamily II)